MMKKHFISGGYFLGPRVLWVLCLGCMLILGVGLEACAPNVGKQEVVAKEPSSSVDASVEKGAPEKEVSEQSREVLVEKKEVQEARCKRAPSGEDDTRAVVVSLPYDQNFKKIGKYELLEYKSDGTLRRPGVTFEMNAQTLGRIHFTPDGSIGLLAQADGSIGVFRVSQSDGKWKVDVVHKAFKGKFYAGNLVMAPGGDSAFVLDPNWRNNGGGIYKVSIACDGTLTDEGSLAPSKLPYALEIHPQDPTKAMLGAKDVLSSPAKTNAFTMSLGDKFKLTGSVDGFGDDQFIISASAITNDGKYVLFGDNNEFSGVPNRIAIVEWTDAGPKKHKVITPFNDPIEMIGSPFNNAVLLVTGLSNGLYRLSYDPTAKEPFGKPELLTYKGGRPRLPAKAVMVRRGKLLGRVLLSENTGIRQIQFEKDGKITDLGLYSFGSGFLAVVGAIGVQP